MKPIDFSCKHDILLQDEEGNLQPMDEPYFRSYPVAADTYRIQTDGDVIDLGGRTLEVFETPDHAVGSICLLDRKARILYSGA